MIPEAREVRLRPKIGKVLEARCRAPSTPQGDLKRAQIVLLAAEGRSTRSIAKEVGVQPRIVSKWRHRFADHGLAGLNDRPRASKKPIYSQATNRRILALLDKPPPPGYARWTGPLLAMALQDVDVQYVWRFLREHNIDLAARKSWCESNDPEFAAKAADVVGLYIDPPAKAIVLCVDEKPSIQALERAQGYLKLPNGRALTGQSHAYKRHGTTTLFAVLLQLFDRGERCARSRQRQDRCRAFQATAPCRVPRLHEPRGCRLPGPRVARTWGGARPRHRNPALKSNDGTMVLQSHMNAFISAYNEIATPFASTKKRVYQRRFKNRRITQL